MAPRSSTHPTWMVRQSDTRRNLGEQVALLVTVALEDRISALTTKDPNKLKVYMGHNVYSVEINGVTHHIRDDDTINFDGKTYTGEEFYEKYRTL